MLVAGTLFEPLARQKELWAKHGHGRFMLRLFRELLLLPGANFRLPASARIRGGY